MKKTLLAILGIIITATIFAQENGFVIKGTIQSKELPIILYLSYPLNVKEIQIDSIKPQKREIRI
ncbi:MAG: hypothetical protein PW786_11515 [Arachidicoccus sp.]|nr:hypothetical protein [Arachidicoccus sp.]